jgi:flagellar motor switch protein FliN/FliY
LFVSDRVKDSSESIASTQKIASFFFVNELGAKVAQGIKLDRLMDMPLSVRLVLGKCDMEIEEILKLGQGSIIELDAENRTPLEVWVNNRMVAKAEVVLSDDQICARILEVSAPKERLRGVQESSRRAGSKSK